MKRRSNGEGSIHKRQDGRWAATLTLPDGKRKSCYGKTRKDAQGKLVQALADVQRGLPLPSGRQRLGPFLESWLEGVAHNTVRPSTLESYTRLLRLHVIPHLGSEPLTKLEPQALACLYGTLPGKGPSPRMVQCVHAVLHRPLKQALR